MKIDMKRATVFSATLTCTFLLMPMPIEARPGELPGGYTCSDLRNKVASYGTTLVLMIARGQGISEGEIVRIRRRCRV